MKSVTINMHTTFSNIDRCPLFCLDLLDAAGRVERYTKWARHEQDNVTLALRELLQGETPTGPEWHTTSVVDEQATR